MHYAMLCKCLHSILSKWINVIPIVLSVIKKVIREFGSKKIIDKVKAKSSCGRENKNSSQKILKIS